MLARTVVARGDASVGEGLPGDFVVLDLGTGDYFSLGTVGGFVWERLDGRRSLGQIAAEVALEFEVEEERASRDVRWFVADLATRRLVRLLAGE